MSQHRSPAVGAVLVLSLFVGLRDLGWIENKNLVLAFHESKTFEERPAAVGALLRFRPDIVVTTTTGAGVIGPRDRNAAGPIRGWTPVRDVPIVFAGVSDPVGFGCVQSLARPGSNMTGLSYMGVELNPKRLQLLKEAIPRLRRIAVLVPGGHPLRDQMVREIEATAAPLGVTLLLQEAHQFDPPPTSMRF